MKQHIISSLKLTIVCVIVFMGLYTLLILGIAQAAPGKGYGESITVSGRTVGYKLIGEKFTSDAYFNGRPSACSYDASASAASNKGPNNPDYLKDVQNRIDTFLYHNPSVSKDQIPSELITASASGLDPDISAAAALVQSARIAKARNISQEKIRNLVEEHIQKPFLGLLGPEKINILQLNIELDSLK